MLCPFGNRIQIETIRISRSIGILILIIWGLEFQEAVEIRIETSSL